MNYESSISRDADFGAAYDDDETIARRRRRWLIIGVVAAVLAVLIAWALFCIVPIIWFLSIGLRPRTEIILPRPLYIPTFTLDAWQKASRQMSLAYQRGLFRKAGEREVWSERHQGFEPWEEQPHAG